MMVVQSVELTIPTTSYANADGTGNRTATVTPTLHGPTLAGAFGAGSISAMVDGSFADNYAASSQPRWADGDYWQFQFGSKKYIDEIKTYWDRTDGDTWETWKVQCGDGSTFTDLSGFTWNQVTQTIAVTGAPAEGGTHWRLTKVGSQAGPHIGPYFHEVEFKIAPGAV